MNLKDDQGSGRKDSLIRISDAEPKETEAQVRGAVPLLLLVALVSGSV